MRRLLVLMCMIAVGSLVEGCSSQSRVDGDAASADANKDTKTATEVAAPVTPGKEVFVFRAKYYQTTGPCIQLDEEHLGMPIIDAFEVVEVLEGDMKAKYVNVQAMTEGGSRYPTELAEGEIYTLRLVPSVDTSRQLRESNQEGVTFLWIDGDEIEKQKASN